MRCVAWSSPTESSLIATDHTAVHATAAGVDEVLNEGLESISDHEIDTLAGLRFEMIEERAELIQRGFALPALPRIARRPELGLNRLVDALVPELALLKRAIEI